MFYKGPSTLTMLSEGQPLCKHKCAACSQLP